MFDLDKWQEIFNTINKHKLRTFLTALGVFWGIFMLVFLMGSGKGLENGVLGMFGNHATNSMYVWTQRTTMPYKGLRPGRRAQLTSDDVAALSDRFPEIEHIAPRLSVAAGEIIHKDNKGSFDVRGEAPDFIFIEPLKIPEGRFINRLDMKQYRKVAVIGNRVKEILFEGEEGETVGKSIKINGIDFLVVGVFKSTRSGEDAADDEKTIYMPLSTAQRISNRPRDINYFVCTVNEKYSVAEAEDKVKALLRKRHKIHPDDKQGVRSENIEEEFRQFEGLFFGIRLIVWIVGIGSLLAGIIGVGNIMLIIVKERTKEIGIRKALGATPQSIISMILLESVFITTIAGYLGLLVSTGLIFLMNMAVGDTGSEFFANPEIDMGVGIGAVLILVVAGALTGLVPALQAARINPVDALKDE